MVLPPEVEARIGNVGMRGSLTWCQELHQRHYSMTVLDDGWAYIGDEEIVTQVSARHDLSDKISPMVGTQWTNYTRR